MAERQQRNWLTWLCTCTGERRRPRPRCCCIPMGDRRINRPDLAIYSQTEEAAAGRLPLWNSPDITTNEWEPFRLMPAFTAIVRNLSDKSYAANTLVHCYTSRFGIGLERGLFATRKISIMAGMAAELSYPLDAETLAGEQRLGVFIHIEHPHDAKAINNRGEQMIDGRQTSDVGRTFSVEVPVRNSDTARRRRINLAVVPGALSAALDWTSDDFAPREEKRAVLNVTVPGHLHATPEHPIKEPVTVVASFDDGTLVGGATVITRIND